MPLDILYFAIFFGFVCSSVCFIALPIAIIMYLNRRK